MICLLPLILYSFWAWEEFCKIVTLSTPAWCNTVLALPFPYSYVQSKYWEVGFLRYYQVKKIPNFIMAAPTLALVLCSCFLYFRDNYSHLKRICSNSNQLPVLVKPNPQSKSHKSSEVLQQVCLLPFAIHSIFLALFCLLLMHVEVATRFLHSSTPWPYWALFYVVDRSLLGSRTKTLVYIWQLVYCALGTILFANFLPFT